MRPSRGGWRLNAAVMMSLLAMGCGSSALSKAEATALLPKAIAARQLKTLPALIYCMTAPPDFTFGNMSQSDLVATFRNLDDKRPLSEAVAADLIRVELKEFPFRPSAKSPDPACDAVHAEMKKGGYTPAQVRLAVVKTTLTKKATDAGVPFNTPVAVATRELVDVTTITPNRGGSTSVKYTWRWAPTKMAEAMAFTTGAPQEATARFRRVDGGWRVEEAGVVK